MKTVTMPKAKTISFTIATDYTNVARGHQPHRSGAGRHAHKATKRNRTRGQQNRRTMGEWA